MWIQKILTHIFHWEFKKKSKHFFVVSLKKTWEFPKFLIVLVQKMDISIFYKFLILIFKKLQSLEFPFLMVKIRACEFPNF